MVAPSNLYAAVLTRLQQIEPAASFQVTLRSLILGEPDATTGYDAETYTETPINAVIVTKATQQAIQALGYHVRLDALAFLENNVYPDDELQVGSIHYRVMTVQPVPFGTVNVTYVADLTIQPLEA